MSIASAISGVVQAGAGLIDNAIDRKYQRQLQERIFEREDSAHQREVNDLIKAGLSPALAHGGSGLGTGAIVSQTPSALGSSIAQGFDTYEKSMSGKSIRGVEKAQQDLFEKEKEHADEVHKKTMKKLDAEIEAIKDNAKANITNSNANMKNAETNSANQVINQSRFDNENSKFQLEQNQLKLFKQPISTMPENIRSWLSNPVNFNDFELAVNKLTQSGGRLTVNDLTSSEKKAYLDYCEMVAQNIKHAVNSNNKTELDMTLSKWHTVFQGLNTINSMGQTVINLLKGFNINISNIANKLLNGINSKK